MKTTNECEPFSDTGWLGSANEGKICSYNVCVCVCGAAINDKVFFFSARLGETGVCIQFARTLADNNKKKQTNTKFTVIAREAKNACVRSGFNKKKRIFFVFFFVYTNLYINEI